MYSHQVHAFTGAYDLSRLGRSLTRIPIIERTSPISLSTSRSKSPSALRHAQSTGVPDMSITFKEVYKEYVYDLKDQRKENTFHRGHTHVPKTQNERISDTFSVGEKLLNSSDNTRPKSRAKTTLTFGDLQRTLLEDGSSLYSSSDAGHKNNSEFETSDAGNSASIPYKKDKKSRKRSNSVMKKKKSKHGRVVSVSTGIQAHYDRQSSVPAINRPANNPVKPSRVASEPPSKGSHMSVVSEAMQDVLRRHEYVPSMSDIRSQRAVKSRLQALEKDATKKREKQKESNVKNEKQLQKDREKQLKIRQRREIYALNKIMTELENKRFMEFCQAQGLNRV
ncbi:uncharacterized protein LOC127841824 isoform X2 [Dreissena polymorpha]|uniref:uncharacterized protein LOC127841824 isoform X2 n=1 Tax=Dreissena polymorpha TaxID=45954 RepID=UPI002264C2DF|nr:uncharacterized protein LOC127841824 isoform X2 [Dreissena polymorpha]